MERLSAPGAVINITRITGRLPLHVSSSGHVLLAFGPREVRERVLSASLARYTAHTLTDPAALRAAVAEVGHHPGPGGSGALRGSSAPVPYY